MTQIYKIAINPPVTPRTISGFTLTPLVSSSKNLNNPALEAGNGAFFLFTTQFDKLQHSIT